jgi:hypothetical protein
VIAQSSPGKAEGSVSFSAMDSPRPTGSQAETAASTWWMSLLRCLEMACASPCRLIPMFQSDDRHPCKSLSTEKHEFSLRALESVLWF